MMGHIMKLYLYGLAGSFLTELSTAKMINSEVKIELIENNY